jgi:uncharacterized protein (TIGR00730 family)
MTNTDKSGVAGGSTLNEGRVRVRRVAVYCGSANGSQPAFRAEATAVADAVLAGGAEVIGILPAVLAGREIAHTGLTSLEMVPTMHERKARMAELADAFLVLPGGYGTLDELMEAVTWAQLGLHDKPCILINTAGYWNGLLEFLDSIVAAGFLKAENRQLLQVAESAADAVRMAAG